MANKIPLNVGPMQAILIEHSEGQPDVETVMPPTEGGTTLTFTFETLDSKADQTGTHPHLTSLVVKQPFLVTSLKWRWMKY